MNKVDCINAEIKQLEQDIKECNKKIHELKMERAELDLTALGFRIGQTIEVLRGGKFIQGWVTGFTYDHNYSTLEYIRILKNGDKGAKCRVPIFLMEQVRVIEQPKENI